MMREISMDSYKIRINGSVRSVESSDPDKPLLYVLRGLGLTATKFGCGLSQCGACTDLIDGSAADLANRASWKIFLTCGRGTLPSLMLYERQ